MHWCEPADPDDPIYSFPNVLALPHLGCITQEAYEKLAGVLVHNIKQAHAYHCRVVARQRQPSADGTRREQPTSIPACAAAAAAGSPAAAAEGAARSEGWVETVSEPEFLHRLC